MKSNTLDRVSDISWRCTFWNHGIQGIIQERASDDLVTQVFDGYDDILNSMEDGLFAEYLHELH